MSIPTAGHLPDMVQRIIYHFNWPVKMIKQKCWAKIYNITLLTSQTLWGRLFCIHVQGRRVRSFVHLCQTVSQECWLRDFYATWLHLDSLEVMFFNHVTLLLVVSFCSICIFMLPVWMSPWLNLPLICVTSLFYGYVIYYCLFICYVCLRQLYILDTC